MHPRCVPLALAWLAACQAPERPATGMAWIERSADGRDFVCSGTGERFLAWGFNYDHDRSSRLLEDYWTEEWDAVAGDFEEMAALGANVVRIHLQAGRFLDGPRQPNAAALEQLRRLLALAERTGLYLDLTGLGCYHKQDVPAWYDALAEAERWRAQACFWEAVAQVCAASPAVFCYDLMNEPIAPGSAQPETDWLAGDFAGKHFVQRISLDLAGRTREQLAQAWVDAMVAAIRKYDRRHLITVGEIPWAMVFPGAKPVFGGCAGLDFASAHFYPKRGGVDAALAALALHDLGRPLLIEETFPLECGVDELHAFLERSRPHADGWIGFYWGATSEELAAQNDLPAALQRAWLEYFRARAPEFRRPHPDRR